MGILVKNKILLLVLQGIHLMIQKYFLIFAQKESNKYHISNLLLV
jgi:hypothetical protein